MINDQILMNIIEAVKLSMDNRKKSQDEAVKILNETMVFLRHRNPDKNRENGAFTRKNTNE